MEVMGLMIGSFVDDYTIRVVDVFAMPQSGTGVSVEAVDPVYQQQFLEMLKQTGRTETVVGWYHSHPGFGCWLSSVDVNTQQSFEQLHPRSVAVVIDPIQSVRGKVVIDAFRCIAPSGFGMIYGGLTKSDEEIRQTTSNLGYLNRPTIAALIHGLNRSYYSLPVAYRKDALEEKMLMNLNKILWTGVIKNKSYEEHSQNNEKELDNLKKMVSEFSIQIKNEKDKTVEESQLDIVGKINPHKHLESDVQRVMGENILQCLNTMISEIAF